MRRYLLPPEADVDDPPSRIVLEGEEFHYLAHVLRYGSGSWFEAIDHRGRRYQAEVTACLAHSLELQLQLQEEPGEEQRQGQGPAVRPKLPPTYYLYQALLKGKKMDAVIRQAAAAGVDHIIPLETERTVAKLEQGREQKKQARWEALVKEAVQQSGSKVITCIHPTAQLQDVKKKCPASTLRLIFHEVPLEKASLHRYLSSCPQEIALFIGPEGGFSPDELAVLRSYDCRPVHLPTNVLRAETAAIYAIGAIQTIAGEREQWKHVPQFPETTDTAEFQ
ncbi:MAG: 16S rRNA (uracil(1498)-N(3))-methyltransferase [Spirochaetia bacterium]|nr:16S rRNA (uracil(1498)-N(3))-methyltransferase [Spirochaetia bacterium]